MIDHVSIPVRNLAASTRFYEALLAPLGMAKLVERAGSVGFGKRYPELWLNLRPGHQPLPSPSGCHLCLRAPTEEIVRRFFAAALAHGGVDTGAPGPRQATMTGYYAAFIEDLDGNRIEAASFPAGSD
jgi:catechol 2,3-dioxygenase-like lactoylglutathione lyase family enzyme